MNTELLFRILFLAAFVLTIGVSAYYRGRARRSGEVIPRRSEGPLALAARFILALTLLVFLLGYVFAPAWVVWARLPVPGWARWAGVALAAYCPYLSHRVFRFIGTNISETVLTKKNHRLVTDGPYRRVRHPLYATGLLLIGSLGLIAANGMILLLGLAAFVVFRFIVIPAEERHLVEKFGEQYEAYRETAGALFPRF